jgi:putative endonuclease
VALMAISRQALGRWGETLAAQFLTQQGYLVIERNYRTPYGEIDLIVQKADTLVFVEVKTRSTDAYGLPETAVTDQKRQHIISAAEAYLQAQQNQNRLWRIDVIAIRRFRDSTQPEIVHFENAIS